MSIYSKDNQIIAEKYQTVLEKHRPDCDCGFCKRIAAARAKKGEKKPEDKGKEEPKKEEKKVEECATCAKHRKMKAKKAKMVESAPAKKDSSLEQPAQPGQLEQP